MMIRVYRVLVYTLICFSFTTLTYQLWPSSFFINRIIGVLIIAELGCIIIKNFRRKDLIFTVCIMMSALVSLVLAKDILKSINDMIYWVVTSFLLWKICDDKISDKLYYELTKSRRFMILIIVVNNILILIGFFLPSCYTTVWEGQYYVGFAYSSHSLSCGICIVLSLTLTTLKDKTLKTYHSLYLIPGTLAIMQSGARTFIISLLVIWIIFYRDFLKLKFIKILLVPIGIIGATYLFMNSEMMNKMVYTYNNVYTSTNTVASFTSGRTEFWAIDLGAFLNFNIFNKLFGNGFDYVYYVNKTMYSLEIWAHNDLLDLLLSVGLFGTIIYIKIFMRLIAKIRSTIKAKLDQYLLIMYIVLITLLNGLFLYQHYLYSFIILFVLLTGTSQKKIEEKL